jgi:glycosyltransferase involved in cell wall biosynthesis
MRPRIGALLTHPIQYYSPWFRHVARCADLKVYYAHRQSDRGQADAGFGVPFHWDVPLLDGYEWSWLQNVAARPSVDRFDGCDTPAIADIIAHEKFDAFVMFGWNKKCFLQAGQAALRQGAKLLIRVDSQLATPRSALRKLTKWPFYAALLPNVAHYLSPGERTDAYLRHYLVPSRRIHRLPHMVDVARFRTDAERARTSGAAQSLRATHGVAPSHFVLLLAAKLIPKKRPLLALQALAHLRRVAPETLAHLHLWFVGDGPLRAEVEEVIREHDLPAKVLGFVNQSDMPAVYAAADCLVLPSDGSETWGLVVNEAFACGLPAIVSAEAGCAPDLITLGETGWRVARAEADELAHFFAVALRQARNLSRRAIDAKANSGSFEAGAATFMSIVSEIVHPAGGRISSGFGVAS